MSWGVRTTTATAILLSAGCCAAFAQDDATPELYNYATYYQCDTTTEARADALVESIEAPAYNRALEEGRISAWGWIGHHTGGKWRRLRYFMAPSLDALLDAQSYVNGLIEETGADNDEFGQICHTHDDYIWRVMAGSNRAPADALFSVYYVCDEAREDRADEIMTEHFAPVLDRYVESGKLSSWGWASHWVGGKYRKLQTMTGSDHKSLLATRNELIGELFAEDSEAGSEFTEICGSHSDYMWNFIHNNSAADGN